MKKNTLLLFLGCTFLVAANFSNAAGINPVKPKKTLAAPFAAVNDNCASAIAITTFPYSNTQTDGADAVNDGFVTVCTGSGTMNDGLWYTVEGNGKNIVVKVTPDDEEYDLELGVFTGSCGSLVCVGTSDNGSSGQSERFVISSEVGVTYYINIGHYSGTSDYAEGNFTIEVDSFEIPDNDNCAGALSITEFPYYNEQIDGAGATADGFVEACEDFEMNDGLWYAVAGDGNNIEISVTSDEGYDIAIGVFTGDCDAFTCVGAADEVYSGEETILISSSEVGAIYYINVGYFSGNNDAPEGNFTINVNSVVPPALPECPAAAVFPAVDATDIAVGTVEFAWEVPSSGGEVDSYDLYVGAVSPLTEDDYMGTYGENTASINLSGYGTVFYWKVVSKNTAGQSTDCAEWSFTTVEAPAVPENDACETATAVTTFPFNETIDATMATNNGGFVSAGSCGTMNDGIWYKVEGNGSDIVISATSLNWDGKLAVYTGSCGVFTCYDSADNELADDAEVLTIAASETGTFYNINFGHYNSTQDVSEGPAIIEITSNNLSVGDNHLKNFIAYPNPVKDVLNLAHTEKISNVEVFNLLGQKIIAKSLDATQGQLDLSHLSSGSYLVKVMSGNVIKTIKVLKQ